MSFPMYQKACFMKQQPKIIGKIVSIIFVTVCSENEVARELDNLHVSGLIPKPWMPEKLAAALQNLRCPMK